jgi:transposase
MALANPGARRADVGRDRQRLIGRDGRRAHRGIDETKRRRDQSVSRSTRIVAAWVHAKKKSFVATERDKPEHVARRRRFCELLALMNPKRFVFIDESFCMTGMRRPCAWSLRGERVRGTKPFRTWRTLSLVGAIRLGQRPRLMTHRGVVNGRVFLRFVKTRLLPWIRPNDIVVMDNLQTHKMRAVKVAIESVGAHPIFLPAYSPDLNPIELWWADMKRELRRLAHNTESELGSAVRRLRASLSLSKVAGWFRFSWRHGQLN